MHSKLYVHHLLVVGLLLLLIGDTVCLSIDGYSYSAVYYASPAGVSNQTSCSESIPCSLSAALQVATPGSAVVLLEGNYNLYEEYVQIQNISLIGVDKSEVVLQCNYDISSACMTIISNWLVIANVSITASSDVFYVTQYSNEPSSYVGLFDLNLQTVAENGSLVLLSQVDSLSVEKTTIVMSDISITDDNVASCALEFISSADAGYIYISNFSRLTVPTEDPTNTFRIQSNGTLELVVSEMEFYTYEAYDFILISTGGHLNASFTGITGTGFFGGLEEPQFLYMSCASYSVEFSDIQVTNMSLAFVDIYLNGYVHMQNVEMSGVGVVLFAGGTIVNGFSANIDGIVLTNLYTHYAFNVFGSLSLNNVTVNGLNGYLVLVQSENLDFFSLTNSQIQGKGDKGSHLIFVASLQGLLIQNCNFTQGDGIILDSSVSGQATVYGVTVSSWNGGFDLNADSISISEVVASSGNQTLLSLDASGSISVVNSSISDWTLPNTISLINANGKSQTFDTISFSSINFNSSFSYAIDLSQNSDLSDSLSMTLNNLDFSDTTNTIYFSTFSGSASTSLTISNSNFDSAYYLLYLSLYTDVQVAIENCTFTSDESDAEFLYCSAIDDVDVSISVTDTECDLPFFGNLFRNSYSSYGCSVSFELGSHCNYTDRIIVFTLLGVALLVLVIAVIATPVIVILVRKRRRRADYYDDIGDANVQNYNSY